MIQVTEKKHWVYLKMIKLAVTYGLWRTVRTKHNKTITTKSNHQPNVQISSLLQSIPPLNSCEYSKYDGVYSLLRKTDNLTGNDNKLW